MQAVSFRRHRFPPDVIRQAVWLYFRFTLSLRDVEEMLAERGIDASYETVRCWSCSDVCSLKILTIQTQTHWTMAPGRDGREDLGEADVALASR